MATALTVLITFLGALYVLAAAASWFRSRYRRTLSADSTYYATTNDGWRLAIHRYRGDGDPVVLCHGMGANAFNMDLGRRNGLATFLRDEGFDVWNVDLRGHGASRIPPNNKRRYRRWTFDDHAMMDVP
ncbi:MAG: alpha/beta fold hydrolase, partial [Myxococcales bacterium]|nr:alpha/beta fold hydrolase [Myxococcales bacterium]